MFCSGIFAGRRWFDKSFRMLPERILKREVNGRGALRSARVAMAMLAA